MSPGGDGGGGGGRRPRRRRRRWRLLAAALVGVVSLALAWGGARVCSCLFVLVRLGLSASIRCCSVVLPSIHLLCLASLLLIYPSDDYLSAVNFFSLPFFSLLFKSPLVWPDESIRLV